MTIIQFFVNNLVLFEVFENLEVNLIHIKRVDLYSFSGNSSINKRIFIDLDVWTDRLVVPFVTRPTNAQGSCGFLLIRSNVSPYGCLPQGVLSVWKASQAIFFVTDLCGLWPVRCALCLIHGIIIIWWWLHTHARTNTQTHNYNWVDTRWQ
jgi:hypothetical protein